MSSVVITGAASGIGLACVDLFTARGFGVVAVDVDENALAELTGQRAADASGEHASARSASGQSTSGQSTRGQDAHEQHARGQVVPLVGDVAEEETGVAMARLALERFGRLDAAVLNAGIGGTLPWEDPGAIGRLDRILAVNVRGVAIGIRSVVPVLRASGGGAIVVTASSAGLQADAGNWAYNASKGAVINMVRAAAIDLAAQNIRVNAIAPGLTRTPLTARHRTDPQVVAAVSRQIPMQRWGLAREHAAAIWFLASPEASYITGATLAADGGLTAHHGATPPPPAPAPPAAPAPTAPAPPAAPLGG